MKKFLAKVFKTTMFDRCNTFCIDEAFTGDGPSTDIVDLGTNPQRHGSRRSALICITETFAGATTMTAKLQTSIDEAFSVTKDVVYESDDLEAGASIELPFPKDLFRYARVYFEFDVPPTAGKVTAGIVLDGEADY